MAPAAAGCHALTPALRVATMPSMSAQYRVALSGFTEFERGALVSHFRLALQRQPGYMQVDDLSEADFVIADADRAEAVQAVTDAGRSGDAVFIGGQPPPGAAAWMPRPIDPLHVLRELDALMEQRGTEPAPLSRLLPRSAAPARRGKDTGQGFVAVPMRAPPVSSAPESGGPSALLVDDSEVALRYLELRLQRHGLRTQRALSSDQALDLLGRERFDFVFLDIELGDDSALDGLTLCQHIQRQHQHAGSGAAPVVVLISAHHSEVDRVRGALAGCDAHLGKPLDDDSLERVLAQHGAELPAATGGASSAGVDAGCPRA